jgi:hypothetical protein
LVVVRGDSMLPTLRDGDRLLVWWAPIIRARDAQRLVGRLAVVNLPPDGDQPRPLAVKRLALITDEGWWVERDNPAAGVDSWLVGAIADSAVLAVVVARCWPRPGRLRSRPAQ